MTVFEGSLYTEDYLENSSPSYSDLFVPSGLSGSELIGYGSYNSTSSDWVKFVDAPGKESQIIFDDPLIYTSSYDDDIKSYNASWKTDDWLTIENFTPKEDGIYNDTSYIWNDIAQTYDFDGDGYYGGC